MQVRDRGLIDGDADSAAQSIINSTPEWRSSKHAEHKVPRACVVDRVVHADGG
jgi:hypothetical protein